MSNKILLNIDFFIKSNALHGKNIIIYGKNFVYGLKLISIFKVTLMWIKVSNKIIFCKHFTP